MTKIRSLEDLNQFREKTIRERQRKAGQGHIQIIVSLGSCGIAAGALETLEAVRKMVGSDKLKDVSISESGCVGLCSDEPILEVIAGESPRVTYGRVTPDIARRIIRSHVIEGKVVDEFVIESLPFPSI